MNAKTISLDAEAYSRLKARKMQGESFSETIKRLVPKPFNVEKWLEKTAADPASEHFIAAVEETIASRQAPVNLKGTHDMPRHNRSRRSA